MIGNDFNLKKTKKLKNWAKPGVRNKKFIWSG
jgi:hypothetical protein